MSPSHYWKNKIQHPRRVKALQIRRAVESGIREFFLQYDFTEVRTPLLVPSPGMEVHIRPLQVLNYGYLPTSP